MDGLQELVDPPSLSVAEADQLSLFLDVDASADRARVPVRQLPPRSALSDDLIRVLEQFFPVGDERHQLLIDLLSNQGYDACGDLVDLANSWYNDSSRANLTPADGRLRKRIIKHLCSHSTEHKNYDRIGKFLKAAAAVVVVASLPQSGHLAASLEETSQRLLRAVEHRAKSEPFFRVVRDKYFADGGQVIARRELVTQDGKVFCCFCAHHHAFSWKMLSKSDFGRLFDHLKIHKDDSTAAGPQSAAGGAEKRAAPSDAVPPPAQKRPVQRSIVDMITVRSTPPPPPPQQRL